MHFLPVSFQNRSEIQLLMRKLLVDLGFTVDMQKVNNMHE